MVVTMSASTSNEEGRRSWCRYGGNFLTAAEALELDRDLMSGEDAQPLEALMRTAGRSAASATLDRTPTHLAFVALCGPGNNGGDGLVLAREVAMRRLGAEVKVWYPKGPGSSELYAKLVAECEATPNVEFVDEAFVLRAMRERIEGESRAPVCFVDALFGFSFKGAVREPFIDVMKSLTALTNDACAERDETELFTASLDIPSGWNVDGAVAGDDDDRVFMPNLMISLTAPKRCCATFDDPNLGERHERMKRMAATHVVAGAFLTEKLCDKYDLHAIPLRRDDDSKVEYAPLELTRK